MVHEYGKETLSKEFKSDIKGLPDSELVEAVVALANTDAYIWESKMMALRPAHSVGIRTPSAYQQ